VAALHALTWREAFYLWNGKVPARELDAVLAERGPELALEYHFTCCVIEDRIAFLARFAGRPFPG
jgi:hypothetical protein